jgi:hypothetical protein
MRLAIVLGVALALPCAATGQPSKRGDGERLIDALVQAHDLRCTYHDDGAADASVLENPVPEVLAVVHLGRRALPLLVAHLDDRRPTAATYDGGRFASAPLRVAVGYVCLDILTNMVRTKRGIVREDCADDGLGACIKRGYWFHPAVFAPSKDSFQQQRSVRVAKANWRAALGAGWVEFESPAWLGSAPN